MIASYGPTSTEPTWDNTGHVDSGWPDEPPPETERTAYFVTTRTTRAGVMVIEYATGEPIEHVTNPARVDLALREWDEYLRARCP